MRNDLPNERAANFSARLRETMMTYLGKQGDPLDRGVTLRDLVESGFATLPGGSSIGSGTVTLIPGSAVGGDSEPDLTPPPTPEGFALESAITSLFITHSTPTYTQGHGHLRTRVYGKVVSEGDPLPTFSDAAEITQFSGSVFAYATNPATTWHIWIKWESVDGVLSASPAGGTNGLSATTGQDVSLLLEALASELDANGDPVNPSTLFIKRETASTVNGVYVPAGVYMKDAYIQNGTITNAKIANAAIDSAKIANASISSANIADAAITSAKIDNAAITTAKIANAAITSAQIANATITAAQIANATITAAQIANATITAAQIADATITSAKIDNTIQSTNFTASAGWQINKAGTATFNEVALRGAINGGAFTGYVWPAAGAGNIGFHLGPNGLLLGNINNGKYFAVEANGDVYAPGFSVVGGNATFSGTLTANTVNTTNIVGAAVTSSYIATSAGGTASVTVSVPAGSQGITIVCGLGTAETSGGKVAVSGPATGTLYIDSVAVATGTAVLVYAIQSPAATSYTISVTRGGGTTFLDSMNLTALLSKR